MKSKLLKLKNIGIVAIALTAFAWTGASAQGVVSTKHNLGSTGPGPNTFSGTDETCVFCHTPHGGDTSAAVPIWNRSVALPTAYTTYATLQSSSIEGATAPVGSVSIACLSCHDGTQAMDSLLNDPGSGLVVTTFTNGTWTGVGTLLGTDADLGQDLSNDHPVGIQYGGGGLIVGGGALNDSDFKPAQEAIINNNNIWWVDTAAGFPGTREKTDMQLYARSDVLDVNGDPITGGLQPYVECASCHDPHTTQDLFLRVDNASSAVCLACHTK